MKNVFYINLEKRVDRRKEVENELTQMNWDFKRFNAIKLADGRLGCSFSHLKLLKMAQKENLEYIIIVEDDIKFLKKDWYKKELEKVFNEDYDVLLLAGNIRDSMTQIKDNLYRIQKSFTTTGYIVKQKYYETLINNIEYGIKNLLTHQHIKGRYEIDVNWFELQRRDKWYIILPRTVTQRASYSDIEKKFVSYEMVG